LNNKEKISILDKFSEEELNIKNSNGEGLLILGLKNNIDKDIIIYLLKRNIDINLLLLHLKQKLQ
jgi:hypothetical protein